MQFTFLNHNFVTLAIIPIFVNTGVAILPAILVGVVSFLSLLLRPKELFRYCRQKPWVPALLIAIATGAYFGIAYLLNPADQRPANSSRQRTLSNDAQTDWAQVALTIIQQQDRNWQQAWLEERDQRIALEQEILQLKKQLAGLQQSSSDSPAPEISQSSSPTGNQAVIYRHNPCRTGYAGGGSPYDLKLFGNPYAEPDTMYLSSPIRVGERIYGASCLLDPPFNYGAVFCLDARSGAEIWYTDRFSDKTGREKEFKAFFSSSAVSADGRYLVIGQGLHFDDNCELICLNTTDGSVHWTVPTPLHIEGSPAIEGNLVVAGAGALEGRDMKPLGNPGYVFAVRLSDGRELWRCPVIDPESSPVIRDNIAYIGSGINGNAVYALRTQSDEQLQAQNLDRILWKSDIPFPAVGAVTLTDNLVLIGCGNSNYIFMDPNPRGAVIALDPLNGKIEWTTDTPNSVLGAIAVNNAVAVCPVLDGELLALDLNDKGSLLWRQTVRPGALLKSGPALTDTHIYITTHDGYLFVLDAADGRILEKHYINAADNPGDMGLTTSSPFVSDGRVYLGSETGGLRCYIGREVRQ